MSKDLIRDSTAFLPSKLVPALVGAATIPLYSRLLGPAEYGLLSLALNTSAILYALSAAWLVSSNLRFTTQMADRGYWHMVRVLAAGSAVAACVLFLLAAPWIDGFERRTAVVACGAVLAALVTVFEAFAAVLRARQDARLYTLVVVGRSLLGAAVGLAIVAGLGVGAEGILIGMASAALLGILPMAGMRDPSPPGNPQPWRTLLREIAPYAIPAGLINLGTALLSYQGRYFIDAFRGLDETGIYAANYDIAEKSIFFLNSMFLVSSSVVAFKRFDADGPQALAEVLAPLMRAYLLISGYVAFVLACFARDIAALVLPAPFHGGWPVIPWVSAAALLLGILHRYSIILSAYKRSDLILAAVAVAVLAGSGANLVLVPAHGAIGAAMATLASFVVFLLGILFFSRRFLIPRFPWRTLGAVAAAWLLGGLATHVPWPADLSRYARLADLLLATLAYAAVLWASRQVSPASLRYVAMHAAGTFTRRR